MTFSELDPAVVAYLRELIPKARTLGLQTSICGQAPSVHPEYAEMLVEAGIDAVADHRLERGPEDAAGPDA